MQTTLVLMMLMASVTPIQTGPLEAHFLCHVKPVDQKHPVQAFLDNQPIKSCVSNGTIGQENEVHVINLKLTDQPKVSAQVVDLVVKPKEESKHYSRSVVFVLASSEMVHWNLQLDMIPFDMKIYVSQNASLQGSEFEVQITKVDLPLESKELQKWTINKYNAITSFTELENAAVIHLKLGEDHKNPSSCVMETSTKSAQNLESLLPARITGCVNKALSSEKEVHIIRVLQAPENGIKKITVDVSCPPEKAISPKTILVLQTPDFVTGDIIANMSLQLLVNGNFTFVNSEFPVPSTNLPNTQQELVNLALKQGFGLVTSYTEITMASQVEIRLLNCILEETNDPMMSSTQMPLPAEGLKVALTQLKNLWEFRCLNDSMVISGSMNIIQFISKDLMLTFADPNCKMVVTEGDFHLKAPYNECGTTYDKENKKFTNRVVGLINTLEIPEHELVTCEEIITQMEVYGNPDFVYPPKKVYDNKKVYVEISLETFSRDWMLYIENCTLISTQDYRLLIEKNMEMDSTLEFLDVPIDGAQNPGKTILKSRFEFTHSQLQNQVCNLNCVIYASKPTESYRYKRVLKKTLQVGCCCSPDEMLNCPTEPDRKGELGLPALLGISFGAFVIGALLMAALWFIYSQTGSSMKRTLVPTALPASGNSSANHSIGSTQSTPCSTSSIA
ncbi:transforming growth factor beta receptor type 3 [Latimeria chalumnae]|uniref:Endoglin n=1 Tax=Latimeria chalumnae TaxID=7897 RepID=M3XJX4_LATCH|nr:PREDICTED: endoglin [Latimeria chalumnae]XP_005993334.1 PREDICTED: endoglin [Latimeria chalumnae]XP_014342307.1 PREDICTED: endoglin [Latimeria chalumnae]|eukprot:XP_005993333.1 PREDICTED: endoglin [Latimeria chalumnae]